LPIAGYLNPPLWFTKQTKKPFFIGKYFSKKEIKNQCFWKWSDFERFQPSKVSGK
jgi:hypothetical protein